MCLIFFPFNLLYGCEPATFYVVFFVSVGLNLFMARYNWFIAGRYAAQKKMNDEIWPMLNDLERRILKKG